MKPRTKIQAQVYALSCALPQLTESQKQWAYKNCLLHLAYRTKKNLSCLDCGHVWLVQTGKSCNCPACGVKLKIQDTRKKKFDQIKVACLVDVTDGFQVTRFFEVHSYHKAGEKARLYIWEIIQHWLPPVGRLEIIARNRMYNWSINSFHGDLEIRDRQTIHHKYNIYVDKVFPNSRCWPIYKRNGFRNNFASLTPYDMFSCLLTDNKAETLLKSKQYSLLEARIGNRQGTVHRFWDSVKICIRSKYIVKDAITWLDYLDLLLYFNKDLRSTKYVCPENIKKVHDKLVAKKREISNRQEAERKRQRAEADQKWYSKAKKDFFGLAFSRENLTIKILETIKEFIDEGDAHKHCVFTNEYYKREDSLIFSARINGEPAETIEVSLSEMKIIQSRGLQNKSTEYHDQIIDLMNSNMHVIRKKYKKLQVA